MRYLRISLFCVFIYLSLVCSATKQQASVVYTVNVTRMHRASLSWVASPSTNVVGYRIYVANQSGGPYQFVAQVSGLDFVDTQVNPGVTYYYVITAIDSNGLESGYSNEVQAVISIP